MLNPYITGYDPTKPEPFDKIKWANKYNINPNSASDVYWRDAEQKHKIAENNRIQAYNAKQQMATQKIKQNPKILAEYIKKYPTQNPSTTAKIDSRNFANIPEHAMGGYEQGDSQALREGDIGNTQGAYNNSMPNYDYGGEDINVTAKHGYIPKMIEGQVENLNQPTDELASLKPGKIWKDKGRVIEWERKVT
jgi:hypothetical protein